MSGERAKCDFSTLAKSQSCWFSPATPFNDSTWNVPFHFLLHGCGCGGFNSVNCFHAGCRGQACCFFRFSFHPPPPPHIPPPPPGDVKCVLKKKKDDRKQKGRDCRLYFRSSSHLSVRRRQDKGKPRRRLRFWRRLGVGQTRRAIYVRARLSLSLNTPGGPGGTLKRFHGGQIELSFSPKAACLRFSRSPVSRQHATSSRLSWTDCEVEKKLRITAKQANKSTMGNTFYEGLLYCIGKHCLIKALHCLIRHCLIKALIMPYTQ